MSTRTAWLPLFCPADAFDMTPPPELPATPTATTFRCSAIERLLIMVAVVIAVSALLQAPPLQSANDRSRWCSVWSLVERGTWQIDEIDAVSHWSTIDKVRYRRSADDPWHFYSSKPPLLSLLAAAVYAGVKAVTGWGLFGHTAIVSRLVLLPLNIVPFWLMLISLCRTLQRLDLHSSARCLILLTAGCGSLLNPYLTTLNNHTPAAATAMFSLAAAVRILQGGNRLDFAVLGFCSSLTACFELPAAQLTVLAALLAVTYSRKLTLQAFLPVAVLPVILFFAANYSVVGSFKPFYATYGSETYRYIHNGIPSYWMEPRDLDASLESLPVYLFHCLLGHHGLLSHMPILLLSVAGCGLACMQLSQAVQPLRCPTQFPVARQRQAATTLLTSVAAVTTLVTLSFYLTRTENYNYGGNSVALRWMLWLSPFWWLAMVPVLRHSGRRTFALAGVLLLASMLTTQWSMLRPWKPSWLYEQMEARGLINYRTPRPPFDPPRYSLLPQVPPVGTTQTFVSSRGDEVTLESFSEPGQERVQVRVIAARLHGVTLLPAAQFPQGLVLQRPGIPARSLQVPTDNPVSSLQFALQRIFGRLDSGRPFASAGTSWIPARNNPTTAWKTERGAVRVAVMDPVFGSCVDRVDAWFCDQQPFGILKWKLTVIDASTSEELLTETWTTLETPVAP